MKLKEERLYFLFRFLDEVEQEIQENSEKYVWVERCINIKELCDYTVTCTYGDMVLIICMLYDYLAMLSEKEGPVWNYYKQRFEKIARRLSAQIDYNYDEALRRCRKKMESQEKENDVGGDTIELAFKYGDKKGKKKDNKGDS